MKLQLEFGGWCFGRVPGALHRSCAEPCSCSAAQAERHVPDCRVTYGMCSMDCVIRKATTDDATAISVIAVAALRVSNAKDYSLEIIDRIERSFSPLQILSFLTQREVYVATIECNVVATASLDGGTVRSVFVDPAYQRMGVGHRLMAAIESTAAQSGLRLLRVPSSITAEGFYYSLGFVKVRDEFHGDERTIIMEKSLS